MQCTGGGIQQNHEAVFAERNVSAIPGLELLLPALRISYNTSVSKATKKTPFSLVFGMRANMPFFDLEKSVDYDESGFDDLKILRQMREEAYENNLEYKKYYTKQYDKAQKVAERVVKEGEWIWVENNHKVGANPKFHPSFLGPFKVTKVKKSDVYYADKSKVKIAHLDRVKMMRGHEPEIPSVPRRRGRNQEPTVEDEDAGMRITGQQEENSPHNLDPEASEFVDEAARQEIQEEGENEGLLELQTGLENVHLAAENESGQDGGNETEQAESDEDDWQSVTSLEADREEQESTILPPDSPFPPTPARQPRAGREKRPGIEVMDTCDRSHVYKNDVLMKQVYQKRKQRSPVRVPGEVEGRVTRSRKEQLVEQRAVRPFVVVPPYPIESKAYKKHLARQEEEEQASK
jgi:hypothetical protein